MRGTSVKWDEAVKSWLFESLNKSAAVIENERYVLDALTASFSGLDLLSIDSAAIRAHCRARLDAGRKPRTVNRDLRVMRAVLRAAQRRGDLSQLPAFQMLKGASKRVRWITFEQSRALLEHLPPHQVGPVAFALETGLRKSNVSQLRWDQVDLERSLAWIHADQAKARRAIPVPLSPSAINILRGQRGQHPTRVFSYLGRPISNFNTRAFRAAVRAAGIEDFTWHDLRRTWASWHAQNGTPMHVLQELGGWSDPSMLKVYAHLSVDHLRQHVAANHDRVRDRHPQGRHRGVGERSD